MIELWKTIKDYEGYYEVSNMGNIRSIDRVINHPTKGAIKRKGRILKSAPNGKGYLTVMLCKNGVDRTLVVHRIVANGWVKNTQNNPQVNHINGIKTDNRVENLEWCDNSYNMEHAINNGLFKERIHKSRKPVVLIKDHSTISFNSGLSAAKYFNTSSGAIGNVLNGTRKSIKGYLVEYL